MKKIFQYVLVLLTISIYSCGNARNEAAKNQPDTDTIISQNPSQLAKDSAILRDDSATIKTAVGLKDEEANAIEQAKKDAQKLKEDAGKANQNKK